MIRNAYGSLDGSYPIGVDVICEQIRTLSLPHYHHPEIVGIRRQSVAGELEAGFRSEGRRARINNIMVRMVSMIMHNGPKWAPQINVVMVVHVDGIYLPADRSHGTTQTELVMKNQTYNTVRLGMHNMPVLFSIAGGGRSRREVRSVRVRVGASSRHQS